MPASGLTGPAGGDVPAGAMSQFNLGQRRVRRCGFGAMQLGGSPYGPAQPPGRSAAVRVLGAAVGAGVDHLDTAEYYGGGVVNDLIRQALHPYPPELAIVSKIAVQSEASQAGHPADVRRQMRRDIEDNLRSLRTDQLAAVNLRLVGSGGVTAIFDDQLAAMTQFRDEGLIAGIGLSNISLAQLQHAARGTDIACVQNLFNVADRKATPSWPSASSRGSPSCRSARSAGRAARRTPS
jgi:pyridoxine 4-dehydrogenase